jgi:methyltransferase (TIGR00027 family)
MDYIDPMTPTPPPEAHPSAESATGPSRTGQAVAAWRVTLDRPSTPDGDVGAQAALCAGMVPLENPGLRAHVQARTRFFDDQVVAALAHGTDQIVVLGAGYDDRALRFRSSGVRFFEVDHPDTQADKRRRLHQMGAGPGGPELVPANFGVDDLAAALDAAGHRADRPSLVLAEGLLIYLEPDAVVELLASVHARSATGSILAASLAVHPDGLDSAWVVDRANAARVRGRSEPWRTILTRAAHLDLVARSGWSVIDVTDDRVLHADADADRSLLVRARP